MNTISINLFTNGKASVDVNPLSVKSEIKTIQTEHLNDKGYGLSFDAAKFQLYTELLEAVNQVKEILDGITEESK